MVCCNDYLISEGALWSNASLNIRLSCTNDFVRGCYNVIMYNVIIRLNRILIVEIHLTGDNSDNQLTTPVLGSELNGWRHFDSWYKSYKGIHGWQRLWELFRWSNSKLEVLSLPQRKRNDERPIDKNPDQDLREEKCVLSWKRSELEWSVQLLKDMILIRQPPPSDTLLIRDRESH